MRCTVVTSSTSRLAGGLFVSTRKLSQKLQSRGVEMDIMGIRDRHSDEDRRAWEGMNLHLFDPRGPRSFSYAPGYRAALEKLAPDLVHCHGLWQYPSVACATWAGRQTRPYLVSPRGMLDPWALANSHLKKQLTAACFQRRHLQRAACLHALCAAEAEAMRAYGLTNPICVVPNGIDLPVPTGELSAPWPVDFVAGRNTILFLGRLHPKKGLPHLLEGWQMLLRDHPDKRHTWCLVIAGWDQGGHRAELEEQATARGIDDSICFTGPLHGTEKEAAFRNTHAFVLPSFSEGMPMAVLEAWAYGVPVGITPQCNIPEGVAAGAAIEMTADAAGARQALQHITEMSAGARSDMGAKGRHLVQERFTWDVVSEQMHRVYEWMLGNHTAPDCIQER